mmetsp:Transcript_7824/g.31689  ORF Transcript_7824/g.31689 Transcript_7824/m.31689 type:complete len:212 (+) Transcript_7824:663-1298(+)
MRPPDPIPFLSVFASGCAEERCLPVAAPFALPSLASGRQTFSARESPMRDLSSCTAASATSGATLLPGTSASGDMSRSRLRMPSSAPSFFCLRPVITANSPRCVFSSLRAFSISSSRNLSETFLPAPALAFAAVSALAFAFASRSIASIASLASFADIFFPFLAAGAGSASVACGAGSARCASLSRRASAAWNAGGSSPPLAPPLTLAYSR